MTQFKDKSGSQRELVSAGLFIYPVLQAADVLAYRANEVPVGDDQRQHVELMRDVAERFNARFGDDAGRARAPDPEVGARIMDLQIPDEQDVDHRRHPAGHRLVLDEPKTVAKKFRSRGHRLRIRGRPRPDKPGISNLIEILAAVRGVAPERGRARVRRLRLRRVQGGGGRRRHRVSGARPRALHASCGPTRRGSSGFSRAAPTRPGRSPSDTMDDVRQAMGVGPVRGRSLTSAARCGSPTSSSTSTCSPGPFDLLLTLILREEVDLLEVDLAES